MSAEFVHLHVHTDYSLLDGACRISSLAAQVKEGRMPAVACTDHGNMFGAVEFHEAMVKAGLNPVLGCEFYLANGSRLTRDPRDPHAQGFHLVLLARDEAGYANLCRLNSAAWLEGFYYKPRIDFELLSQCHEGLTALTACIGGEVPARLLEGDDRAAAAALRRYLELFGRERLYIELQDHGMAEEKAVNPKLVGLADEYGLGLVATNDAHYLKKEHAPAHDVLLCVGTGKTLGDANRMRFQGTEFYLKSPDEMAALFAERPDAVRNSLRIAEQCHLRLTLGDPTRNHYPVYQVPDGVSREQYLRSVCVEGLRERYGFDADSPSLDDSQREIVRRMDFELQVIARMHFTSYFLVVWDFIRFAHRAGIPVGPGRGSGAGSLVAYLTRITDINPLRYSLLFERFLNPERVSPPDFDIDFCERRRHEVIAYVREKYGRESVAQIGTFGTLKTRAVLKDVARVLGRPFADGNRLTRHVPGDPKMTLEKALEQSPELRALRDTEPWVGDVLRHSQVLEGLHRNTSVHAAGVIIGDQPLANLVPLARGADEEIVTQYPAKPCEKLGLLKMDFLGLRTLTILRDAYDMVKANRGVTIVEDAIPLDDPPTYELLNKGSTVAVFQLESSGMRDLCRRFGVRRIEDIIALIALFRPGPMSLLDEFIARKTGQKRIEYDVPEMKPALEETYGIMLYQEQVMQVVQRLAGFTLGQADTLRSAMSKKNKEVMAALFPRFIEGCGRNGIAANVAKDIWEKILKFSDYGFNKSHSAAYAMLSYRTAYMKANYAVEFMAAVLTSELGNAGKLAFFLRECHEMGIEVTPPDINTSGLNFTVDGARIRFGLGGIKGVGSGGAEEIMKARAQGPFKGLLDFCERVPAQNRRVMENLCRAGAFDRFGLKRSQIFAILGEAMASAQHSAADRRAGQGSLFDLLASPEDNPLRLVPPDIPEWEPKELLTYEKALLGFYVTGHPLGEHAQTLALYQTHSIGDLLEGGREVAARTGGIVARIDVKLAKRDQRKWAVVQLEGLDGALECLVFADAYEREGAALIPEAPVFVEGTLSSREGGTFSLLVERVIPISEAPRRLTEEIHVRVFEASTRREDLERLRAACAANPGETALVLCITCATGEIAFVRAAGVKVSNTAAFRQEVTGIFGEECLWQKARKRLDIQPPRPRGRRRAEEPREVEEEAP